MNDLVLSYALSEKAKAAGVKLRVPAEADAGFDLPALEAFELAPGQVRTVPTGVHMAIPVGWVGLIRDRSSVGARGGHVLAGVIDASYRGEIRLVLVNLGPAPLEFSVGDRIAQCVIVPHLSGNRAQELADVDALGKTERGAGGFGSTGA